MAHRQTRIFVPPEPPFDDAQWAETLVGSVIKPLIQEQGNLPRFWFSRYVAARDDSGDCDINLIPEDFGIDSNYQPIGPQGNFRSVRFRYEVDHSAMAQFEQEAGRTIDEMGCAISEIRDYPFVQDLGGDRFIGGVPSNGARQTRADLVYSFLHSTSLLIFHCLIGPDENGKYKLEESESDQNPLGSIFESVHHLFCNATDVPTTVRLAGEWTSLQLGTYWMQPLLIQGDELKQYRLEVPIKF